MAPSERQRARDELSAARDRYRPYRLGKVEEAAPAAEATGRCPFAPGLVPAGNLWLLMIAMVIVPFVQGLVLATFLK